MGQKSLVANLANEKALYAFYAFLLIAEVVLSPSFGEAVSPVFGLSFLLLAAGLATFALLIYRDRRELFNVSRVFRSLSSAEGFRAYDAFGALALIAIVGWVCDAVAEGWYYLAAVHTLNFWTFLVLFHKCSSPRLVESQPETTPAQNLYLCLSTFNENRGSRDELRTLLEQGDWGAALARSAFNWAPILRTIVHHSSALKTVFVLTSQKSSKEFTFFCELVDLIRTDSCNFLIAEVGPADIDNANEILEKVGLVMNQNKPVAKEDACFYISGGTSAVSAAYMLLAVRNRHQAEYLAQTPIEGVCNVLPVNINARLNA